jgi:ankyrin repeat protein
MQKPQQSPPRPPSASELDEDTLAFVRKVFHFARTGDARELATLLGQGLPPNLRKERGDSLPMLACYHGHADAARVLLEHGADPQIMTMPARPRSPAPPHGRPAGGRGRRALSGSSACAPRRCQRPAGLPLPSAA